MAEDTTSLISHKTCRNLDGPHLEASPLLDSFCSVRRYHSCCWRKGMVIHHIQLQTLWATIILAKAKPALVQKWPGCCWSHHSQVGFEAHFMRCHSDLHCMRASICFHSFTGYTYAVAVEQCRKKTLNFSSSLFLMLSLFLSLSCRTILQNVNS